jgi:transglutaminase-like putative cysteine protease
MMKKSTLLFFLFLLFCFFGSACVPNAELVQPTGKADTATEIIVTTSTFTATVATPTATSSPIPTLEPTNTPEPVLPLAYVNQQQYSIDYSVVIRNTGYYPTDLRLYLPIPSEWDAQTDLNIEEIFPEPKSQDAEETSENRMAYWQLNGTPKKGDGQTFRISFTMSAYETITHIDSSMVQMYQTDTAEYERYTKPEKYIESNDPKVMQLAEEIAGEETNPYLITKMFFDYIIDTYKYSKLGQGLNGAKYLLENGIGECGDYSALFIALSRAKGIPARPVVGYWAISGTDQTHVWAEFFLEGIGWIPVDATVAQLSAIKHNIAMRDYYFGNMDNQRIILSKGFNIKLVPAGPNGFIAPLLQTPYWFYWGSGNTNNLQLYLNWMVDKQ